MACHLPSAAPCAAKYARAVYATLVLLSVAAAMHDHILPMIIIVWNTVALLRAIVVFFTLLRLLKSNHSRYPQAE